MDVSETAEIDRRLDRMIEIADLLDCSLDYVVTHMGRCPDDVYESISAFLASPEIPSRRPR